MATAHERCRTLASGVIQDRGATCRADHAGFRDGISAERAAQLVSGHRVIVIVPEG
jgi:hypothetical protein